MIMITKLYSVTDPNMIADQFERCAVEADGAASRATSKRDKAGHIATARTWRGAARMIRDTHFINRSKIDE